MADNRYDHDDGSDNWDETPKNDGGNYYRPYGSTGGENGNGFFSDIRPPQDTDGASAKTIGLVGLFLTICFCRIAGIILGIIGYNRAIRSIRNLGYETPDASTARVLGIVDIVLGALLLVGSAVTLIFSGLLTGFFGGEGLVFYNPSTAV